MTIRADANDAGCWIDGHWGQYGIARMIQIAEAHGYVDNELTDIADRHLASMGTSDALAVSTDEFWAMPDAVDDVEAWMNEHVAPEGFSFGWHEGEFFLWSDETWAEESY